MTFNISFTSAIISSGIILVSISLSNVLANTNDLLIAPKSSEPNDLTVPLSRYFLALLTNIGATYFLASLPYLELPNILTPAPTNELVLSMSDPNFINPANSSSAKISNGALFPVFGLPAIATSLSANSWFRLSTASSAALTFGVGVPFNSSGLYLPTKLLAASSVAAKLIPFVSFNIDALSVSPITALTALSKSSAFSTTLTILP